MSYKKQDLCTEVSCNFQIFGSSKINLTARIPKTEIYSSKYYLVFLKRCCCNQQFSTAEIIMWVEFSSE